MAELATIARPYAQALFGASKDSLEVTNDWLQSLAALAGNRDVLDFVSNPKTSNQQVMQLFEKALPAKLPDLGQKFLTTLAQNKRIAALPEVAAQYTVLKNKHLGAAEAKVTSAYEMTAAQQSELQTVLEKRFGRKLNLTVDVDESLIGGVKVQVGDEVLDTSVQARLNQLKQTIAS